MRQLTDREVRFLCWKVKQGKRLPDQKLVALLSALLARKYAQNRRAATNDNASPFGPGCSQRNFLFRRYERCIACWMRRVASLGDKAGKRSRQYPALWKEVVEARARASRARDDYERHMAEHGCCGPERSK